MYAPAVVSRKVETFSRFLFVPPSSISHMEHANSRPSLQPVDVLSDVGDEIAKAELQITFFSRTLPA